MSEIGTVTAARSSQPGEREHPRDGVLLRGSGRGQLRGGCHRGGQMREVVLPLEPAVGPHPRIQEHAPLGGLACSSEPERQRAVDHLVTGRPVGRAGEEVADLGRTGVRIDARRDVDDDEFADQFGVGCRDRGRGESAERLPHEQLGLGGPRRAFPPRHRAPGAGRCRRRPDATTSLRVRADRSPGPAGRARGSSCPRCGR